MYISMCNKSNWIKEMFFESLFKIDLFFMSDVLIKILVKLFIFDREFFVLSEI